MAIKGKAMTGLLRMMPVVPVLLALAGCNIKQELNRADAAVASFHGKLDREQYDQLWSSSADGMKKASPQPEFVRFLKAIHTKLGNVNATHETGFNINENNGVTSVTVSYDTDFEKGKANETFVFLEEGQRLELLNYNINSMALVTG